MGRLNRALPQRVVVALLRTLRYPNVDNIYETYGAEVRLVRIQSMRRPVVERAGCCLQRHCSGVDLVEWLHDLSGMPGRSALPTDPQWLWNVYVAEYTRTGLYARKTLREKLRRWNKFLAAQKAQAITEEQEEPAVPVAFRDPRFACVDAYIRFFACVRWTDHCEILELFRTLRLYADRTPMGPLPDTITKKVSGRGPCVDRRHARSVAAYIRPFFRICANLTVDIQVFFARE